jgi:UDP-N-acetylglucosamine 2-epimerase (non-hydrolysing)
MSRVPKILLVVGTRPEAIKLAPVVLELRKTKGLRCALVLTGQHPLAREVLRGFGLKADFDLKGNLSKLDGLIGRLRPALVVVQGDTTSAVRGALAGCLHGVPVAHVEAGLRTYDWTRPFPEELNRALIDDVSSLLFPPTKEAAKRIPKGKPYVVTGNTGIDALRLAVSKPRAAGPTILATLHRRESVPDGLRKACSGLKKILAARPDVDVLFPLHPNPAVAKIIRAHLKHPRAKLVPPLDYFQMVAALKSCRLVMTDSGGLQEEAAALGKPCLVLREVTDRPEAVKAGTARVAGLEPAKIASAALRILGSPAVYKRMARPSKAFGDGRASKRVVAGLRRYLALAATGLPKR